MLCVIPRFWQKHPHAQQACLLSLPLGNLDVISQGHLDFFFQINFSFSNKIMFFLTMPAISFSLFFDIIAKHGIVCFTGTFSASNIWKMLSKIP